MSDDEEVIFFMKKLKSNSNKHKGLGVLINSIARKIKEAFSKNKKPAEKNIYSKVNSKNRFNEIKAKIFSNRGILIIVLVAVVLLFMTCSKQESGEEETAASTDNVTELDGNAIEKTDEAVPEDNSDPMTDTTWEVLQETRKILSDSNEAIKLYITDAAVNAPEDTEALVADVDDELERVRLINPNIMTEEEALRVIDEMDGLLDELAACIDTEVPNTDNYEEICAILSGTMWLDDDLNMYGFESDGSTLYLVDNESGAQSEGKYEIKISDNGNIFLKMNAADMKVEAIVSSCSSRIFEFTDINTEKTVVLSPVEY